jgi:hypothetical protein
MGAAAAVQAVVSQMRTRVSTRTSIATATPEAEQGRPMVPSRALRRSRSDAGRRGDWRRKRRVSLTRDPLPAGLRDRSRSAAAHPSRSCFRDPGRGEGLVKSTVPVRVAPPADLPASPPRVTCGERLVRRGPTRLGTEPRRGDRSPYQDPSPPSEDQSSLCIGEGRPRTALSAVHGAVGIQATGRARRPKGERPRLGCQAAISRHRALRDRSRVSGPVPFRRRGRRR